MEVTNEVRRCALCQKLIGEYAERYTVFYYQGKYVSLHERRVNDCADLFRQEHKIRQSNWRQAT